MTVIDNNANSQPIWQGTVTGSHFSDTLAPSWPFHAFLMSESPFHFFLSTWKPLLDILHRKREELYTFTILFPLQNNNKKKAKVESKNIFFSLLTKFKVKWNFNFRLKPIRNKIEWRFFFMNYKVSLTVQLQVCKSLVQYFFKICNAIFSTTFSFFFFQMCLL